MMNTQTYSNNVTRNNSNKLVVPQSASALEQMKYEIAQEMGVELGGDATARANGRVGGEMTKRLIALGQKALEEKNTLH